MSYRDEEGYTPLAKAVEAGHARIVGYLLAQGAEAAVTHAAERLQPMHLAERHGHGDVARLLRQHGAD